MTRKRTIFDTINCLAVFATFVAIMLSMVACGPPSVITHREVATAVRPTTAHGGRKVTKHIPVSCSTGESKCEEGSYYTCVHVEGDCRCRNVTRNRKEYVMSPTDDRPKMKTVRVKVRECYVSNLSFRPSNATELADNNLEWAARSRFKCFSNWNSTLGRRSGNFWLHVESRDGRCKTTSPNE